MKMKLLAARLDRSGNILVNTRLDGYPAFFHLEPRVVDAWLSLPPLGDMNSLSLLESNWERFEAELARLVRRHGNDFIVTQGMMKPA
ncbi:hypothetical protein [Paludibacterium yongneupense]|uniref:hypothetical protein n=1 Tax=Paludibacterium yongneupense TaxID=400061 RepID=UPI0004254929|nr:hypothetical protein [Paludibacterium yongneupense]